MAKREPTQRVCDKGHEYFKSSACPTCPICENEKKPPEGFLSRLSAPAKRALLQNLKIDTLEKLSEYSEKEILALHGMGKASMPILKEAMNEKGLSFREEN